MIDKLIKIVRGGFEKLKDHRRAKGNKTYALSDLLSIGFATFSLKDSSLVMFRKEFPHREANLLRVYGLSELPSDTALREGLDGVRPSLLQGEFKPLLEELRTEKVLKSRKVLGKYLVISCDGTGHYCSGKKCRAQCMVKHHKDGRKTHYHQLLGAVNVHPEQKTVFPVAVEAIVKQDGCTKNDCELNASKRLIPQIRDMLPDDELIGVFDALYANGPHIKTLMEADMRYIIGIKEGYVLIQVERLKAEGKLESISWKDKESGNSCTINFGNKLILNGQHQDILVNFFEYREVDAETGECVFYGTWITDIPITKTNAKDLVSVGRSRWKIENETFNTLKNQGYHLEHNYGHGKKYLATNFAILTMLAFLVDQIAQHLDTAFQKAWKVRGSKKALWKRVQQVFDLLPVSSMNAVYRFICGEIIIDFPLLE